MARHLSPVPTSAPADAAELRAEEDRADDDRGAAQLDRSELQYARDPGVRTRSGLPVVPCTYARAAHEKLPAQSDARNYAEDRVRLPAQGAEHPSACRSQTSIVAAEAYRRWREIPYSERKLSRTRQAHAAALFRVTRAHGVTAADLGAVLEVAERQALKFLNGEAPIPTSIFDALPKDLAEDFAAAIGRPGSSTAAEQLRRAIARAEREGVAESALMDAFARLGALSARQRGGGR